MIRGSIRRPVAISMTYLTLVALGIGAWTRLPIEFLPNTSLPRLSVTASWGSSVAEAVERFVTAPLESEIQLVRGVDKVTSTSSKGTSSINVTFARGTDMNFARLELSERLNAMTNGRLPAGATVRVSQYIPTNVPGADQTFLSYQVNGPYSLEALYAHTEKVIKPALEDLEGVAAVTISGGGNSRLIRVELDGNKLTALGIQPTDITQRVAELEYVKEVGLVDEGGIERTVTIRQRVDSAPDIRNLVISERGGRLVRVADVGRVLDTYSDPTSYHRIDGFPVVTFTVEREPRSNAVDVAERVKAALDSLRPLHPQGVRLFKLADQSVNIRTQLEDLRDRAVISAAIIFFVLLLFLGSMRSTAIVFSTIAFSILIALICIYLIGYSLNVFTLMGLAMGFGLVVDDAIVVLENIYRRWKLGEPAMRAAENGSREVVLAVVASTLTTVVVLIPFVYLQGELRIYYLPLAIVVGFSILASQFVAFTFIPALAARLLGTNRLATAAAGPATAAVIGGGAHESSVVGDAARPEETRSWYVRLYAGLLGVTLRFPWIAVVLTAGMLYGSYHYFNKYVTRGRWYGSYNARSTISIRIGMPEGEDIAQTDELARFFEDKLRLMPEVERFETSIPNNTSASILVSFPDSLEYTWVPQAIYDQIAAFAVNFAGPSISVSGSGKSFSTGGGSYSIGSQRITVYGYNFEKVRDLAQDIAQRVMSQPRVPPASVDFSGTGSGYNSRATELYMRVDRRRLALHNLSVSGFISRVQAALSQDAALQGAPLNVGGDEVRFDVKIAGFRKLDVDHLLDMLIPSGSDQFRIADVATIEERKSPSTITRENQRYHRYVSYEFRGPQKLADRTRRAIVSATLVPDGFSVIGDSDYSLDTSEQTQIYGVLSISLVLIFMVTAALFESIKQPLIVLLTVPMALIGVFLLFFNINASFTREAYIGVIMMGGIVVKNAILLVDRVNQLRRTHHLPLESALVHGTLDRVRPILMTSTVTIAGVLPLVLFSENANANIWNAFGYALMGGLTSSTILVLSVSPAIYLLFERRAERRRLRRAAASAADSPHPAADAPAPA
jgi:hydrophobic/amphiphilic exporter-1 (mainly G- bacteria), HAE1 family